MPKTIQKNVFRLQVAVDNSQAVQVFQRNDYLSRIEYSYVVVKGLRRGERKKEKKNWSVSCSCLLSVLHGHRSTTSSPHPPSGFETNQQDVSHPMLPRQTGRKRRKAVESSYVRGKKEKFVELTLCFLSIA